MNPLIIHRQPEGLRRPVLITAFSGWNDAAESATTAARYLGTAFGAEKFAEIDPEEFYHFGLTRPYVRYKAGSETEREIVWPTTDFSVARASGISSDLIIAVAGEPHLKWRTYCEAILELAKRCDVSLVLTLGALLAEVPHTRPIRISGGASDPELAARLGVKASRYEGPTGIVGVLNTACRDQGLATASVWANVPHYISGIENPKAALAIVERVLMHQILLRPVHIHEINVDPFPFHTGSPAVPGGTKPDRCDCCDSCRAAPVQEPGCLHRSFSDIRYGSRGKPSRRSARATRGSLGEAH